MQEEKLNEKNNGITLVALIITIIVMLILAGVSTTVALNGGLINTAKEASDRTQTVSETKMLLEKVMGAIKSDGTVDFDKLNAKLPDGFTCIEDEETYKIYISETQNKYKVDKDGDVTLENEQAEV